MLEQAITISNNEIVIRGQFFVHKDYSLTKRDVILDVLSNYYCGQVIRILLFDGENFEFSGFSEFIKTACDTFAISYSNVIVETHDPDSNTEFSKHLLKLGIFISVNQHLPIFSRDLTNAKFVGALLGRYNISRLRLAYELDTCFPDDNFITFQPTAQFVEQQLGNVASLYKKELTWLQNKTFDRDLTSPHYMGMIDWHQSCSAYSNVWNKYQIEVISETDAYSDFWFTEKTANCLATGKPFVLVAGPSSLARLRSMGFQTFDTIIDECYDDQKDPTSRIKHLIASLQELYKSPNKEKLLTELYKLAECNIELYQSYIER